MNVMSPDWTFPGPSAVAIGVFDGVHRGHAAVLERMVEAAAGEGLRTGVLTFDPHPVEVLAPGHAPRLLVPLERRVALLGEAGIDWVGVLDLAEIRTMAPEVFVGEVLVKRANAAVVVVGEDFRFGHRRAGDVRLLSRLGPEHGYRVMSVSLLTDGGSAVSSTRIRDLIADGDVVEAARLLGRPHRVSAPVVRGEARGRLLGFPTANLIPPVGVALPADGIYAVAVTGPVEGGGVASLGVRPTFETAGDRLLEVHLFDFSGEIYGSHLHVDFMERLRGELRFERVEDLVAQMESDARQARQVLGRMRTGGPVSS